MKNKKIFVLLLVLLIAPIKVKADLCKTKPINYKIEWCLKDKPEICLENAFSIPENSSLYFLKTSKIACETGYTETKGMCIQTANCSNDIIDDTSNEVVEFVDDDENCEETAEKTFNTSTSKSGSVSLGCYGSASYTCTATIHVSSRYNFHFRDWQTTPIKSLVANTRSTQYAPGTGTTFEVLYNSNISYSVSYNPSGYTFTVGAMMPHERCWPTYCEDDDDFTYPWPEVPATCSNKEDANASLMSYECGQECETYYTCDPVGTISIDCSAEIGAITVEAVKAENDMVKVNYVNGNTPTTKGDKTEYLGKLKDDGTTNSAQKFKFNVPEAFVNIKNGTILYNGINYNGQNTDIWKSVTPGYYIPTNAIPEQKSIVSTGIGGTAYIIKVNGVENKRIDVSGELKCPFTSKIPGCPYQPCGDDNCNPAKDEYKCCRNSAYLAENPNYYGTNCTGEDAYLYRQIDLGTPFPNRLAGENWNGWISNTDNQKKLTESFKTENLEYSVDLTNTLINKIREYNDKEENKYTSWTKINDDGSSTLLKDTNELSMEIKKTQTNNYYALGCGPNTPQDWMWCN